MKKRILTLIFTFLTLLLTSVSAQKDIQQTLDRVFGERGEVCFTFHFTDRSELDLLTRIISIDNVTGNEVFAYANRQGFSRFLEMGYDFTIQTPPSRLIPESELRMGMAGDGPLTEWNFYPTYEQYVGFMQGFASSYPAICHLDTIGTTIEGRLLLSVKISDNVNEKEGEPEFFYTSSIHGDETTGYVLMLHMIDYLLTNYGTDPRITEMVDNIEIFINPLANPDGTYHGGNNTVFDSWRFNANAIDLNRNYPDPAEGPHPDGEAWQPETEAFMAWADSNHFVMGANFHGGISIMNYPWDTWAKLTADDEWWQFVCREYVDTVHLYGPGWYYSQYENGITNGYQWYRITGGRQDYMNYWHSDREVTNEISDTKLLAPSQLLTYWGYNYRSLLNYLEQVRNGVQGTITDSVTGQPLDAKVYIFGFDKDNSHVFSKLPSGYYSRLLFAGNYSMTFSRTGYFTKLVNNISVQNRELTPLDIQLVPLTIGSDPGQTRMTAMAFPNPSDGRFTLALPAISTGETNVEIYGMSGRSVFHAVCPPGKATLHVDLKDVTPGLYMIRVHTPEGTFGERIVIR